MLAEHAPLYGRANEIIHVAPLDPRWLGAALSCPDEPALVQSYAAWGGVPRYWELAVDAGSDVAQQIDRLVLDPLGPLHREPERLLRRHFDTLCAEAWEEFCRLRLPRSPDLGGWGPASRWWRGAMPEWDLVSESEDGERLLLGEAKWSARPFSKSALAKAARALAAKSPPPLPERYREHRIERVLFVPAAPVPGLVSPSEVRVVTAADLLR